MPGPAASEPLGTDVCVNRGREREMGRHHRREERGHWREGETLREGEGQLREGEDGSGSETPE